jgi:hypothetical protein
MDIVHRLLTDHEEARSVRRGHTLGDLSVQGKIRAGRLARRTHHERDVPVCGRPVDSGQAKNRTPLDRRRVPGGEHVDEPPPHKRDAHEDSYVQQLSITS